MDFTRNFTIVCISNRQVVVCVRWSPGLFWVCSCIRISLIYRYVFYCIHIYLYICLKFQKRGTFVWISARSLLSMFLYMYVSYIGTYASYRYVFLLYKYVCLLYRYVCLLYRYVCLLHRYVCLLYKYVCLLYRYVCLLYIMTSYTYMCV